MWFLKPLSRIRLVEVWVSLSKRTSRTEFCRLFVVALNGNSHAEVIGAPKVQYVTQCMAGCKLVASFLESSRPDRVYNVQNPVLSLIRAIPSSRSRRMQMGRLRSTTPAWTSRRGSSAGRDWAVSGTYAPFYGTTRRRTRKLPLCWPGSYPDHVRPWCCLRGWL